VSGARFNIDKMEIIPIGMKAHRKTIADTRKINAQDNNLLPQKIRIARDGEAVHILGAWIGNEVNNQAPWEPILNIIKTKLNRCEKAHLTLNGKRIILQAIVGGHTQFLAKAQGMPKHIEDTLMNIMTTFIWEVLRSKGLKVRRARVVLRRKWSQGTGTLSDVGRSRESLPKTDVLG